MIAEILSAVTSAISVVGSVVSALFSESGALASISGVFMLSIAFYFMYKGWNLVSRLFARGSGRRRK